MNEDAGVERVKKPGETFGVIRFTMTDEHVKLLRAMWVGWCDDEFGAPEIVPKRPYGNSSVVTDIHELLDPELTVRLDDDLEERYRELHLQTKTALQIVLRTGAFEPGVYEADPYRLDWRRA